MSPIYHILDYIIVSLLKLKMIIGPIYYTRSYIFMSRSLDSRPDISHYVINVLTNAMKINYC